jgi:hypothetical protein
MEITIKDFEDVKDEKRVGFSVTRGDGLVFVIDRNIPLVDGKSDDDYIDEAYSIKGRNGKTAKQEIEEFETWKPTPLFEPEVEKQEEKVISANIGKVWNVDNKKLSAKVEALENA